VSRIIAGTAKGRRLAMPAGSATRPTTDRVREAVFSRLVSWAGTAADPTPRSLSGLSFCDLYAGSGAVGLEAASRGAAPVVLVESDRRTAEVARRNAAELGLDAQVRVQTVAQALTAGSQATYDIIWADPPYDLPTERLDELLLTLWTRWRATDGLIVVERSSRSDPPSWPEGADGWEARYGDTTVFFGQ